MSRLFLMRHAQPGPGGLGSEPCLTKRGRAQARAVGQVLNGLRPEGSALYCSPVLRCRETADLLGPGPAQVDERLALDHPPGELVDLAQAAGDASLLVGHQPELLALLAALLPGGAGLPIALPPASLIGLRLGGGDAVLTLYLEPEEPTGQAAGLAQE